MDRIRRNQSKLSNHALAAKNIKIELRENFPDINFRVHSKSFSMGNDVSVHWFDGPTSKQVDEIIQKYQEGWFDGRIDLYEYHKGFDNTFGSAKYVFGQRSISLYRYKEILEEVCKEYSLLIPEIQMSGDHPYISDYTRVNPKGHWNNDTIQDLVNRRFSERSYVQSKSVTPKKVEPQKSCVNVHTGYSSRVDEVLAKILN